VLINVPHTLSGQRLMVIVTGAYIRSVHGAWRGAFVQALLWRSDRFLQNVGSG